MKKILILTVLLMSTICSAQIQYAGIDTSGSLVAKTTLSNLASYSEQADNAAWTKGAVTITADNITAPDGTTTADRINVTVGTAAHAINNATPYTVTNGVNYRMIAFVKAGTSPYVKLRSLSPTTANINVNLTTGLIVGTDVSVISSAIRSVGNGWYRIEMVYQQVGTSAYLLIYPTDSGYNTSWTAAGTETIYVWGMVFQLASSPSTYLQTTSAAATLAGVCPSGTSQSLLDPSKCFPLSSFVTEFEPTPFINQNALTYSEQFDNAAWGKSATTVTANTTVAPDGATTGDSMIESATTAQHYISRSSPYGSAGVFRYSVYAKSASVGRYLWMAGGLATGVFDLSNCTRTSYDGAGYVSSSITSLTGGWCNIQLVGSSYTATMFFGITNNSADTGAIDSYAGDGTSNIILWGASSQLEANSPNYVPTTTAAVTSSGSCPIGYEQNYRNPSKCNRSNTVTAPTDYVTAASVSTAAATKIADAIWATAARTITGGTITTNSDKSGYSLADGAISALKFSTDGLNRAADVILRRDPANVEASAYGDTLDFNSLYGMTQFQTGRVLISGGELKVYKSNNTDLLSTRGVTSSSAAAPITGITP